MSRTKEYNLSLMLAFIDFEKAFDSVCPIGVIEALFYHEVYKPYVEMSANIYREATARVSIYIKYPRVSYPKKSPTRRHNILDALHSNPREYLPEIRLE